MSCRVEEVNSAITQSLSALEVKVDSVVEDLRQADQQISDTIVEKEISLVIQIDQLKTRVAFTDSQLCATKMVLNATQDRFERQRLRMVDLEKTVYRNLQHGREWNIEIDGIPAEVGDNPVNLQEAALKNFSAINVPVQEGHIDAIHRLNTSSEPKPTIIRFHSRKIVKDIHENSKKLKNVRDLHLDIPGITNESKIFVRPSQCPYYRSLSYNCRVLRRKGRLEKYSTGKDGKISIKIGQSWFKIQHENDLIRHFPNFEGFTFKNEHAEHDEHYERNVEDEDSLYM